MAEGDSFRVLGIGAGEWTEMPVHFGQMKCRKQEGLTQVAGT
jgi:hypothetical protein